MPKLTLNNAHREDAKEIMVSKSRLTPKIYRCHSRPDRESRPVPSTEGNRNDLILGSRFRGNDEGKIFSSLHSAEVLSMIDRTKAGRAFAV